MRTPEEVIEQVTGIKPGADKFTPLDYEECIKCMKEYAGQAIIAERIKILLKKK